MKVLRRLSPLYELSDLIFVEAAVRNAAAVYHDLSRVTKWIRYNALLLKIMFTFAALFSVGPAFFDDKVSYASSLLSLFFFFLMFGTAYAHGYFQVDLSYMHTFFSRSDISKVRFYGFFRLFDWPAVIALLSLLVLVGMRNPAGLLPALLGFLAVIMGALSIVILLGKRLGSVQTGRSLRAAFFRIFGLIAWLVSIYGLYLINQLAIYLMTFKNYEAYDSLFPISYGLWISQPFSAKYAALSLFYFALITLLFFYAVRELSKEEIAKHYGSLKGWKIKRRGKMTAMVIKDFKQLFRNPQLFVIALLPIYGALMQLVFYIKLSEVASVLYLQIFLAITVSSFMSLERSSYITALPLTDLEMKFSKILEGLLIYFVSMGIVAAVVIYKGGNLINSLSLFPTGFAVVLVAVQFSRRLTSEPVNVEAVIATLISFFIVLVPAAVGGVAVLILKAPFSSYAFPVSLAETLAVLAVFALLNRRKAKLPFRL
ncbi:hypothetical protein [Archaeoglobus sp.]|uniref:hypothetical protein n=1 Tax=Archaeoglobus sp. TaxID=1872626 RepID=UPI0024AC15CD|nr:hypothetical protein [Archaeoglobus sp.]MDI3498413.1 uncharacterized protein [Archaeoglobus sp.]